MNRQVRLQTPATLDLRDHYLYLLQQEPRTAERFALAIDTSFDRLLETPDLGFVGQFADTRLHDVRCWQVRGFQNHLIYYRITTDGIEVLRVLHGSRDADQLL